MAALAGAAHAHAQDHQGRMGPGTLNSYANTMERFRRFCIAQRILQGKHLPVLEEVLCAFAAHRAGRVAGATVRNDVAGVHVYHTTHGLLWPSSPHLKYILTRVERTHLQSSRKDLRLPASLAMLRGIYDATNWTSDLSIAVFACTLVAFWGQFRLGKLLVDSLHAFDPAMHPVRAAWSGASSPSIQLPWTKTTRNTGAVVSLPPQPCSRTCPVTAMITMIQTCPTPPNAPLFGHMVDGTFRPLTKRLFLAEVNQIGAELGLGRITGHCFRISGTTQLLASGVPPDVVKAAGQWASDSFLCYWREHERVLPQHVIDLILLGGPS
jgi:hypothetical protein